MGSYKKLTRKALALLLLLDLRKRKTAQHIVVNAFESVNEKTVSLIKHFLIVLMYQKHLVEETIV